MDLRFRMGRVEAHLAEMRAAIRPTRQAMASRLTLLQNKLLVRSSWRHLSSLAANPTNGTFAFYEPINGTFVPKEPFVRTVHVVHDLFQVGSYRNATELGSAEVRRQRNASGGYIRQPATRRT
jgi:hypothetical protein